MRCDRPPENRQPGRQTGATNHFSIRRLTRNSVLRKSLNSFLDYGNFTQPGVAGATPSLDGAPSINAVYLCQVLRTLQPTSFWAPTISFGGPSVVMSSLRPVDSTHSLRCRLVLCGEVDRDALCMTTYTRLAGPCLACSQPNSHR